MSTSARRTPGSSREAACTCTAACAHTQASNRQAATRCRRQSGNRRRPVPDETGACRGPDPAPRVAGAKPAGPPRQHLGMAGAAGAHRAESKPAGRLRLFGDCLATTTLFRYH
jgi:hypothetical protein